MNTNKDGGWNGVYVATTPVCTNTLKPQKPDCNELSVAVTIQLVGSVLPVCQTFAESVEPETRNRNVYDDPAFGENGAVPRIVVEPLIFFCTTKLEPSIYALYQLFPSIQRNTPPMFVPVPLKLLSEPLKRISALVVVGPSTAL